MTTILGNGLLASACKNFLKDDSDLLIFASGVSNSQETSKEVFMREEAMLREALKQGKFTIYFSTCSIDDPTLTDAPYIVHKKNMECLVRSVDEYAIFRLPQVVGNTPNPHTLTNYLYKNIITDTPFQIWQRAQRNLIDVDDVVLMAEFIYRTFAERALTISLACPFSIYIQQLVDVFESVLGKKANFTLCDKGGSYTINTDIVSEIAPELNIDFDELYIEKLINKYYDRR